MGHLSRPYMTTGKTIDLTRRTFVDKVLMKEYLGFSIVKNPPASAGDEVWSVGWEDTLEEEMATHSSILAWKIPWTDEPDRLHSKGSQRVGRDWATEHTQWKNKQCSSQYFGSYGAFFFFLTLQTDILVEVCTRIQLPQGCYNSPKI